jgi:hypothetical protein
VSLAGLEPAPSSLSEMDSRSPCQPAFPLVVPLRKTYKDGVDSLSAADRQAVPGRAWPRSLGPAVDDDQSPRPGKHNTLDAALGNDSGHAYATGAEQVPESAWSCLEEETVAIWHVVARLPSRSWCRHQRP